ncbi:hypothetical protein [Actinomycetospora termitidis]|uniref:Uncharacterized protein n=1 Tax=Actinomycetospora termitidis TaxID=3053470 RepID=A0ABT7M697_9PSEU|nr:hypothetical protein [Actinomycetospora sp. Odt1-22]MDL5156155.1 hypothetical protein [Actinomycetospora sp. Odt1-22]
MTLPGPCPCDEDDLADGFVVLVVDPVTGRGDCYGPYPEAQARGQAQWRRLEFDVADLPDVLIGIVPWHAERPREDLGGADVESGGPDSSSW